MSKNPKISFESAVKRDAAKTIAKKVLLVIGASVIGKGLAAIK